MMSNFRLFVSNFVATPATGYLATRFRIIILFSFVQDIVWIEHELHNLREITYIRNKSLIIYKELSSYSQKL